MSNFYNFASFIIPCSADQALIAMEALSCINGDLNEFAEATLKRVDGENFTDKEKLIRHCFFAHPDQEGTASITAYTWDFNIEACSEGLWISPEEPINTGHAAIFTQAVLLVFDLDSLVVIQASNDCSAHRTDAYGGHSIVVTKDYIRRHDSVPFIESEQEAHRNKERYFICDITELNGQYEYTSHFLMKCASEIDPQLKVNEIFMNYRGDGDMEDEFNVVFSDGLGAKDPNFNEISALEFKSMQAYIPVL